MFRIVVCLQLNGYMEERYLATALKRLQVRHPRLRAVISPDRDQRTHFHFDRPLSPVPFEMKDSVTEEPAWREETDRLLNMRFQPGAPLAAVTVIRSRAQMRTDLLLAIHHAVADGMSAITLVHDLLNEYAKSADCSASPPPSPLQAISAPRAKRSGGLRERLWLLRRAVRMQVTERRSTQSRLPELDDIPPLSQWVHWVFSNEETRRLVRWCRKERTSITGLLVAAVFCGLMESLGQPEGVFKCQFPLDVRDAVGEPGTPVTPQDLGCFISIMNGHYSVRDHALADLARNAHESFRSFIKNGGPSLHYNMARLAKTRFVDWLRSRVLPPRKQRPTLFATNYGVLKIAESYGELKPVACTLMFKNADFGPSLIMEALILGQQLNVGFAANGLVPGFWDQLQGTVRKHLDIAAGPIAIKSGPAVNTDCDHPASIAAGD